MYVSFNKVNPLMKHDLSGIVVLLYIPLSEIAIENTNVITSDVSLLFNVSDKYTHVIRYVDKLHCISELYSVHEDILHELVRGGTDILDGAVLREKFHGMRYNEKLDLLYGVYEGVHQKVQLDSPAFRKAVGKLRSLYEACKGDIYYIDPIVNDPLPEEVSSFIKSHNYDICREIYVKYRIYRKHNAATCTSLTISCTHKIQIREVHGVSMDFIDIKIKNMSTNKTSYIDGLTYKRIRNMLEDPENTEDCVRFNNYVKESLDWIGLRDVSISALYRKIIKVMDSYKEVNFSDDESLMPDGKNYYPNIRTEMTDYICYADINTKDPRYAGCTIGYLPNLQGTVDKDYFGEKESESSELSMTDLKWFLLYLMDHVIRSDVKISHALPVYVYKNSVGKLSATFNYVENPMDFEPSDVYDNQSTRFAPAQIADILSYYDDAKVEEYKKFIGTRPDIRVIIDDDIIIN